MTKKTTTNFRPPTLPDPAAVGLVGVLLGGPSAEREISLKSGRAVARALRDSGYRVAEIGEEGDIEEGLRDLAPDVAFIALHGRYGEDGQLQARLEEMNIPYTGSGIAASRRAMNKIESRKIFAAAGLPLAPGRVYRTAARPQSPPFPLPVVIKPAREGSSIGLSLVRTEAEFAGAVARAREHDPEILVERYVPGRELTAGVLDDRPLPLVEIRPGSGFFDYRAKYVPGVSRFTVPARLPIRKYRELQDLGLAAHRALGCFSFSRADIILGPGGEPFLLEVNTIPGFTETSLLPQAAAAEGIDFAGLCRRLLAAALTRGNYRKKSTSPGGDR